MYSHGLGIVDRFIIVVFELFWVPLQHHLLLPLYGLVLFFFPESAEFPDMLDVSGVEISLLGQQLTVLLVLEVGNLGRVTGHQPLDFGLQTTD